MIKHLSFLISVLITFQSFSQTNAEKAMKMADTAIALMDSGMIDQSIKLLQEAKLLDPENYIYDYETGYAYSLRKDYSISLDYYKKVIKYKNITDRCYQMLGNLYDINGEPSKALKTYDKGLKIYPNSGRLFLEKGNMYWNNKEYWEALKYYEQGIYFDPSFPSNYYRAALIYCNSDEEVWGMIYGEIFMNLECNSDRTMEISKLLYDTYYSQIQFTSDTSYTVSFSKQNTIYLNAKDLKKYPEKLIESIKLPYGTGVYEPTLMFAILGQNTVSLRSLSAIRTQFINHYYEKKFNELYPVVLFDYQKKMIDLGLFDAYNHWILMKGNEDEFGEWLESNKENWENFRGWFMDNSLTLTDDNKFYSSKLR